MTQKYLFNLLNNYKPEDPNKTNIFFYGLTFSLKEREKDITMECIKETISPGVIPYLSHILNKYMNFVQDKNSTKFWEVANIHSMINQYRIEHAKSSKDIGYLNIDDWDNNKFSKNLSDYLKCKYFSDELELERSRQLNSNPRIESSNCGDRLEEIVDVSDDGLTFSLFSKEELDTLSNKNNEPFTYNKKNIETTNSCEDTIELKKQAQQNKSLNFFRITTNSPPPERVAEELERRNLF